MSYLNRVSKNALSKLESAFNAYVYENENPLKILIGLVSPNGKIVKGIDYETLEETTIDFPAQTATFYLPAKFEKIITSNKRFIVLIGGRGSGKSIGKGRLSLADMLVHKASIYCLREFQKSIKDSVHSLLSKQVNNIDKAYFEILDSEIRCNKAIAAFAGIARNPESVKSAYGFLRYWVEEAQTLSEKSLQTLTPTARAQDTNTLPLNALKELGIEIEEDKIPEKASITFTANPSSSEDPFSKRFIVPFIDKLDKDGIYEDDLHLIVKINYHDNPWFLESGLNEERVFDKKHLDNALYEHIWEGEFNDSIENALIKATWFDACIDSHIKLGFGALGESRVTHDPSDTGADNKAVTIRTANVIKEALDRDDLDVNEGCDWALGIAIQEHADIFEWDVGGMGIALKRDVNNALKGKQMSVYQFNGQSSVDLPKRIYEPCGSSNIKRQLTNKQVCKNLRAQCYLSLRDRVYKTYRAVVFDEIKSPDELISFSSECSRLKQLRSELSRIPIKPNAANLFELYSKKEMREKFDVKSPNLADCVMMSERVHLLDPRTESTAKVGSRVNHWN